MMVINLKNLKNLLSNINNVIQFDNYDKSTSVVTYNVESYSVDYGDGVVGGDDGIVIVVDGVVVAIICNDECIVGGIYSGIDGVVGVVCVSVVNTGVYTVV